MEVGTHFAVIAITVGLWSSGNSVMRIFVALNPSIPDSEQKSMRFSILGIWRSDVSKIGQEKPIKQRWNFPFLQASNAKSLAYHNETFTLNTIFRMSNVDNS
jgi:hypothetical protein